MEVRKEEIKGESEQGKKEVGHEGRERGRNEENKVGKVARRRGGEDGGKGRNKRAEQGRTGCFIQSRQAAKQRGCWDDREKSRFGGKERRK